MTDRRPPPSNSVGANDDCLYRSRSTTPLITMRVDPKNIGRPFSKGSDDEDTAAGDDEPTEPVEEEDSMDELEQRQQKISGDLLSKKLSEDMRLQQSVSSKKLKLRQSPSELGPPEACTISASKSSLRITNKMKALRYFSSSKYDFVKVKVLLLSHDCDGSSKMHVSILSRYIIRRILTSVDVSYQDAVRIALLLKKSLVDQDKLILTQDDLECELFSLLKEYNYGQEVIHLYKKFYTLHLKKVPMIILVTGPPGLEKPQIAATLADRLNLSITLKTEVVLELLSCMNSQPQMDPKFNDELSQKDTRRISQIPSVLALDPLSQREPDWKSQFLQECQDTLVAMKADILKHIQEGKSFIIEGIHISNDLVSFIHDALDKFSTQKNGIPQSKHAIVASYRLSLENPQLHKEKLAHQLSVLHALSQEASETLVENNIFQKVQQLDRWYEQNLSSNFVTFRAEDHLISQAVQYIHEHFLCLVHNFS